MFVTLTTFDTISAFVNTKHILKSRLSIFHENFYLGVVVCIVISIFIVWWFATVSFFRSLFGSDPAFRPGGPEKSGNKALIFSISRYLAAGLQKNCVQQQCNSCLVCLIIQFMLNVFLIRCLHIIILLNFWDLKLIITQTLWEVSSVSESIKLLAQQVENSSSGWGSFWERSPLGSWFSTSLFHYLPGVVPKNVSFCGFRWNASNLDSAPKMRDSVLLNSWDSFLVTLRSTSCETCAM